MPPTQQAAFPDLQELVQLFYADVAQLASFAPASGDELPEAYARLLDHNHHMTVTLESYHGCPVEVQVLEYAKSGQTYIRKILLTRQSDGQVVMFGIVRLHTQYLTDIVREEIEARRTPLGRVLIEHNVLRRVELGRLWRVAPAPELCGLFRLRTPAVTFGRTAIIHCDEEPAIELVEIVAPDGQASVLDRDASATAEASR